MDQRFRIYGTGSNSPYVYAEQEVRKDEGSEASIIFCCYGYKVSDFVSIPNAV